METPRNIIKIQHQKIKIQDVIQEVISLNCGAVSTFIGTTRDNFDGKKVLKLEYEAYEPMALKQMENICVRARSKWDIQNIAVYHRLGEVPMGETSVAIAVSSPHRIESLKTVEFIIETLKADVPIWKKEVYQSKDEPAQWKENKECRWSTSK